MKDFHKQELNIFGEKLSVEMKWLYLNIDTTRTF